MKMLKKKIPTHFQKKPYNKNTEPKLKSEALFVSVINMSIYLSPKHPESATDNDKCRR